MSKFYLCLNELGNPSWRELDSTSFLLFTFLVSLFCLVFCSYLNLIRGPWSWSKWNLPKSSIKTDWIFFIQLNICEIQFASYNLIFANPNENPISNFTIIFDNSCVTSKDISLHHQVQNRWTIWSKMVMNCHWLMSFEMIGTLLYKTKRS